MNSDKHITFSILFFILVLAAFILSNSKPAWLDEISTIEHTSNGSILNLISNLYNGADSNPPLYYLLISIIFKYINQSLLLGRLFSFSAFLLGIFFIRKLLNPREYLGFYLTIMTSTYLLFYLSNEIRAYSLLFMLATLFLIIYTSRIRQIVKSILIAIIWTLLLYTHYYSIFYFFAFFCIEFLHTVKSKKYFELIFLFIPILLFLPWIPAIINQLDVFKGFFWQDRPTLYRFLKYPYFFLGGSSLLLISLVFRLDNLKAEFKLKKKFYLILLSWLMIPLTVGILTKYLNLVYVERYFTISIIPLLIIIPKVISYYKMKIMTLFLFIYILSFSTINIYNKMLEFENQNKKLTKYLKLSRKGKDVFCESPHVFYQLKYYSKMLKIKQPFLVLDKSSAFSAGNVKNSAFDFYGNLSLKNKFNFKNILIWDEIKDTINSFYLINEKGRMFFENILVNNKKFTITDVDDEIKLIRRNY